MDVKTISVEMIKPSLPTPNHLRNHKICLLDQLTPADYAPIVIFYPNENNSDVLEKITLLKQSLSDTLSRFYPLAGTIACDLSVDCDDEGARFTTVRVRNRTLSGFLESPDLKLIAQLLPCGLTRKATDRATNVQVSEFECGGISIGICISHKLLDGASLRTFLKSWADSARSCEPVWPDYSASSLFPGDDLRLKDASMAMWCSLIKKGPFVTRRFVFDGPKIEILRDTGVGITGIRPTRVETTSGFIWKCAMAASRERYGFIKSWSITHLVNLRTRASPNLPEESTGNLVWVASGEYSGAKEDVELSELVGEVRGCLSKIDGDFVTKMMSHGGSRTMEKCLKEIEDLGCGDGNVDHLGFTSWCKLGFYDVDFGWGRPAWVSSVDASGPHFMNLVILIDGRFGGGIEAWVTMDEQEMGFLEHNREFRAFASFNPSPLNVVGNDDDDA